ncbi:substrate-binding domain-containing protein [Streptomyces sp. NBC_00063]|uniref:substrate-binding domain-containing protein n=1 Tax=Streptomyces sp. NBC_00063 TaxID=2975638 RepID=UPI003D710FB2
MSWFDVDVVMGGAGVLIGIASIAAPVWIDRRAPRRKRIGYRKQMDTVIGGSNRAGASNVRLGLFDEMPEMSDATLVLLRIENDGSVPIGRDDYTDSSPHHGLTAVFEDRTVRGVAVTLPPEAEHLMGHFDQGPGLVSSGSALRIPRVPLNPGAYYKLLVLLTGGPVDSDTTVQGDVEGGELHENHSVTPDEKPPVFGFWARRVTGLLSAFVIALAALALWPDTPPPPDYCEKGTLTVTGSTAFAPVAEELKQKYEEHCPDVTITVSAHGSQTGVRELALGGARGTGAAGQPAKGSPAVVAFSDGPRPASYTQLSENHVAVSLFTLVVSDRVRLRNLRVADVRRLYRGEIRSWAQLGGPDLPVVLVSRTSGSGTRRALQDRVLAGGEEPRTSSDDCTNRTVRSEPVLRCELDSTDQVLDAVARIPGALGYSELRAATELKGLHRLSLDGHTPDVDHIESSGYPYREIEFAYTYGRPPADSLASSFLAYAIRGPGQDVVRTHGHLPCGTPVGLRICGKE